MDLQDMLSKLLPGTYRLTCDVKNPKPDRRAKYDWRLHETFKAGTLFAIDEHTETFNGRSSTWLEFRMPGKSRSATIHRDSEVLAAIVPYLERIEEKPSDWLEREGWRNQGTAILDQLVSQGTITMDQVKTALQVVLDRYVDEENGK